MNTRYKSVDELPKTLLDEEKLCLAVLLGSGSPLTARGTYKEVLIRRFWYEGIISEGKIFDKKDNIHWATIKKLTDRELVLLAKKYRKEISTPSYELIKATLDRLCNVSIEIAIPEVIKYKTKSLELSNMFPKETIKEYKKEKYISIEGLVRRRELKAGKKTFVYYANPLLSSFWGNEKAELEKLHLSKDILEIKDSLEKIGWEDVAFYTKAIVSFEHLGEPNFLFFLLDANYFSRIEELLIKK